MSARPHDSGDDTSRRHREVAPMPVSRPLGETMGSPAITTHESSSARGATYTSSHVRNEIAAESQIPHGAQERVDVERDGAEHRRRSATSTKDQGSIYPREGERTRMRDEPRPPPKEEDQHRYNGGRVDDRGDTLRRTHDPALRENSDLHRPPPSHAKGAEPIAPGSERRTTLEEKKALEDAYASLKRQCEERSKELSSALHERQEALVQRKETDDAYAVLRQRYEEQTKELNSTLHERQAALVQRKETDDAYAVLRRRYEEQTKENDAVRQERRAAIEQKRKTEEHYAALRYKYDTQKIAYSTLHDRCETLKATLEQRTSELHGVQKFLTTADTFSGSEVVNMLRKLNEEVQQTTTFMAEWAVGNFMFGTPPPDQTSMQTIKQTRTSKVLGMRLVQLLGERKHRDDPIVVEMAFRAYLIYELFWIASSWSTGQQQSHNEYIDGIHQRMQEGEGQAISGNWRALTRKYTFPDCMNDRELAHKIDSMLVSGCTDILLAAGCTTPKSDIGSGLWSKFSEKMHHFVSLAGQVNKIIGMGVISEDFHVVVVAPDAIFNKNDMEDSYDNDDKDQRTEGHRETVLCATELGLLQRGGVGAGAGQGGEPSESIVMKPKVALVSVMDIFNE